MNDEQVVINGIVFEKTVSSRELEQINISLAKRISQDYRDRMPTFLVVLNGAFMFAADLLRRIEVECEVFFVKLSSYQGMESAKRVETLLELPDDLENRDIVIIEDIVDSGFTMSELRRMLKEKNVNSIEICSLMYKPDCFKGDFTVKYIGKSIGEEFIVGYGLDLDSKGRNLAEIYQRKNNKTKE